VTRAQFTALAKRLLPALPSFSANGPLLFVSPLGHTIRGILLSRCGDPRRFYVEVFLQPLFIPAEHLVLNCGWRLGGGAHTWDADSPTLTHDLSSELLRHAVPFLKAVESPRDVAVAARATGKTADAVVLQFIAYAFARAGNVAESLQAFDQLLSLLAPDARPYVREWFRQEQELKALLAAAPDEAQRRLLAWERQTKGALRLDGFE
jgi:hypothetical protein